MSWRYIPILPPMHPDGELPSEDILREWEENDREDQIDIDEEDDNEQ